MTLHCRSVETLSISLKIHLTALAGHMTVKAPTRHRICVEPTTARPQSCPTLTPFYLHSGRRCSSRLSVSTHLICTRVKKKTQTLADSLREPSGTSKTKSKAPLHILSRVDSRIFLTIVAPNHVAPSTAAATFSARSSRVAQVWRWWRRAEGVRVGHGLIC